MLQYGPPESLRASCPLSAQRCGCRGLPAAVQLVARHFEETTLFRAAFTLEGLIDGSSPIQEDSNV